jgi:hypothetical protein
LFSEGLDQVGTPLDPLQPGIDVVDAGCSKRSWPLAHEGDLRPMAQPIEIALAARYAAGA